MGTFSAASGASNPQPISDALRKHFDETLAAIPTGKRGSLSVGVTTQGVEAGIGWKVAPPVTVTGWAARMWGGEGWTAGARAAVAW